MSRPVASFTKPSYLTSEERPPNIDLEIPLTVQEPAEEVTITESQYQPDSPISSQTAQSCNNDSSLEYCVHNTEISNCLQCFRRITSEFYLRWPNTVAERLFNNISSFYDASVQTFTQHFNNQYQLVESPGTEETYDASGPPETNVDVNNNDHQTGDGNAGEAIRVDTGHSLPQLRVEVPFQVPITSTGFNNQSLNFNSVSVGHDVVRDSPPYIMRIETEPVSDDELEIQDENLVAEPREEENLNEGVDETDEIPAAPQEQLQGETVAEASQLESFVLPTFDPNDSIWNDIMNYINNDQQM